MITIKHQKSGKVMDVTEDKWREMNGRNRNWEKIGQAPEKKAKGKPVFIPAADEQIEGVLNFKKEEPVE